jgi:uncharacterized membrane protein
VALAGGSTGGVRTALIPGIDRHQSSEGKVTMANRMANGAGSAAPEWLRTSVQRLERNEGLDAAAEALAPVADPLGAGARGDALRGKWLGHALHPLLTDFPLGCWLSAGLLDIVGGRKSRPAARRLVGLGLLFSLPTAAAGMADWSAARTQDPRVRRLGVVHAAGNAVVALLYFRSWRARRRGRHLRGVAWGLTGGTLAWGTGWLGGHMAIAYGTAQGERGLGSDDLGRPWDPHEASPGVATADRVPGQDETLDLQGASERLGVPPEQVQTMVDQGLLVPVDSSGDRFRENDVEAVRLLGG